jgi:ABC-type branched-subunit amino acid transport system substrate-binding protein
MSADLRPALTAAALALGLAVPSAAASLFEGVPAAELPRKIDATPAADLVTGLETLSAGHPAAPWICLRLGRLRAHVRDFRGAAALFARGLAGADAKHPARTALTAERDRLAARDQAVAGRIGVLLPVSGPYAGIGKSAFAAVKLAAEGDATAPRFELFLEDTGGEADRAAAAVERLVLEKKVTAIIGPVGVLESQAAALAAERAEVPIITLTGGEGVTGLGPFSFRHRLTRGAYARSLARYALDQMGLRTFAVLYPESDYGREMRDAFWKTVEQAGGEVKAAEGYSLRAPQFNGPIKRLVGRAQLDARAKDERWAEINRKARDPAMRVPPIVDFEAVFVADTADRARQILPFLAYWDVELKTHPEQSAADLAPKYGGDVPPLVQVLGTNAFNDPEFALRVGEPGRNSVFLDEFMADAPAARDFTARFQAATGSAPDTLAAHAFDAARMAAKAGEGLADRAEVRRRLLGLRDFPGVVGKSQFNGDGEIDLRLNVLTIGIDGTVQPRFEEQGYGEPDDATP